MSAVPVVVFAGSRFLPSSVRSLVSRVVLAVLSAGFSVWVGCASGGDAFVLSSFLALGAAGSRLSVFAVGGSSGAGFWRCSAFSLVRRAAAAGARVVWWAGGGRSVPLRSRLWRRSRRCVFSGGSVASRGGRAGFVAFVSGGRSVSPGSWGSARLALSSGLSVVVFPVSCSVSCFPSLGSGSWVVAGSGVWASGFRWVPS